MGIQKNIPHEATKEKPSYLLFGFDCRSPTEAAFLPMEAQGHTDVMDYREEVVLSLASARELTVTNTKKAQKQYKQQHDHHATSVDYKVGDLVLVKFPHEECRKKRKLSCPWNGPYRFVQHNNPDLTVTKQFFPEDGTIQMHQLHVCPCPQLPIDIYWYDSKSHSTGHVPRWVEKLTQNGVSDGSCRLSGSPG